MILDVGLSGSESTRLLYQETNTLQAEETQQHQQEVAKSRLKEKGNKSI